MCSTKRVTNCVLRGLGWGAEKSCNRNGQDSRILEEGVTVLAQAEKDCQGGGDQRRSTMVVEGGLSVERTGNSQKKGLLLPRRFASFRLLQNFSVLLLRAQRPSVWICPSSYSLVTICHCCSSVRPL